MAVFPLLADEEEELVLVRIPFPGKINRAAERVAEIVEAKRIHLARQVDPLRFNDFGYTLGGPVYFPRKWNTDKDKLFFFVSQEWKYSHTGATRLNNVPTAAERAGDFRNSSLPAPVDPLNGVAFPDRVIPAARFSHDGPRLLTPLPL